MHSELTLQIGAHNFMRYTMSVVGLTIILYTAAVQITVQYGCGTIFYSSTSRIFIVHVGKLCVII